MKKIILMLVIGLMMIGAVSAQNILQVDDDTLDDSGCVDPTFQCKTIGAAITAATNGDTINVAAGSYTESLTINKGVTISGAGSSSVTLNGLNTITASGVTISGFTFAPVGGHGITIDSSSSTIDNMKIINNVFTLLDYSGVHVGGENVANPNTVTNVNISYNTFNGPDSSISNPFKIGGFYQGQVVSTQINGVYFEHNIVSHSSIPIGLQDANINHVVINDNTFRNTDGVIYLWAKDGTNPSGVLSNFIVTNNDIDSTNSYGVGFDANQNEFDDSNFGTGNTINNNKFVGIPGKYGFKTVSIISTLTSYSLDAKNNWWGDTDPSDSVSANVDYSPWCTNSGCTEFGPVMLTATSNGAKAGYPTIQAAITVAAIGDTINVAAGTYTESLTINKGVTINGAGSGTTTINGLNTIITSDVTLTGFTFAPVGGHGITIDSSVSPISNMKIINNVFTLLDYSGVHVGGENAANPNTLTNVNISYNTFNGPDSNISNPWKIGGFYAGEVVSTPVEGVYFEHNIVSHSSIPIGLQDANINHVVINDNTFRNTDGVIYLWAKDGTNPSGVLSNFIVTNNDIDSTNSYGVGFDANQNEFDDSNFGTGNTINNNKFVGIPGKYGFKTVSIISTLTSYNLNAENNWWGDASGPTHTSNPSGTGGSVSDNVNYDPWCSDSTCAATTDEASTVSYSSTWASTVKAALDYLFNRAAQDSDGVNIYLHKGWNTFKMPWFVLTGTAQNTAVADALAGNYSVTNVLESINGNYNYLAYYDGAAWQTYVPGDVSTFTAFPTAATNADYDFHIYMTALDRLVIE